MAPRDPRSPGRVMGDPHGARSEQEYMKGEIVMETASVKSRRKTMVSSSRLPVRRECERLEGVKTWRRLDTHPHRRWQVCRFGHQNRGHVRCSRMAVPEDTWRHREACVEAKRSCEGGMSVRWPDKMLDGFTPKRYLACMLNGGRFGLWSGCLYIESGLVEGTHL